MYKMEGYKKDGRHVVYGTLFITKRQAELRAERDELENVIITEVEG